MLSQKSGGVVGVGDAALGVPSGEGAEVEVGVSKVEVVKVVVVDSESESMSSLLRCGIIRRGLVG